MRAAIYARYSSENQRPESIEDQINSCRKLALSRGYIVDKNHVFSDEAASGARSDRRGLASLMEAAKNKAFKVILVDDLSRLARDNLLMLSIIAELHFHGIKVVSVADGLDTADTEAKLSIQIRGIFNELQLEDLRKKTFRGQLGQKQRGFTVGERTFGYRSEPVGTVRMDKKGRPRPEGYRMVIDPSSAGTVLKIFQEFAKGDSQSTIIRRLNSDGVIGPRKVAGKWSQSTLRRILTNQKYIGIWTWNKTEMRRDPRTGRRRSFPKPESEWVVQKDESLRIVSQELWDSVQQRLREVWRAWPRGRHANGFQKKQASWVTAYPNELLSGAMECGLCGSTIVKVSGKGGGYYGCLGAKRGKCTNKLMVRRKLAEKAIIKVVRDQILTPGNIEHILKKVLTEIVKAGKKAGKTIRLKEQELAREERRLANFIEFIADGRKSRSLEDALLLTESKVNCLKEEIDALLMTKEEVFQPPPHPWIEEKVRNLQQLLEQRTPASAGLLRKLLGKIRLEPVTPDIGKPYFRAVGKGQVLAVLSYYPFMSGANIKTNPSDKESAINEPGEKGSNSWRWWR